MAYEPKVKVAGTEIKQILSVSYSVFNGTNANGEFTQHRRCGGIAIERAIDSEATLAAWAQSADKSNWQSGSIEFMDRDRQVLKKLEWEDGYLQEYELDYSPDHQRVLERITIMPQILKVEGKEFHGNWDDDS